MQIKDLRSKTEKELHTTLSELRKNVHSVTTDLLKGKEKNVKKVLPIKRDIARVLTVLSDKKFERKLN